jgi:hypothetical protein
VEGPLNLVKLPSVAVVDPSEAVRTMALKLSDQREQLSRNQLKRWRKKLSKLAQEAHQACIGSYESGHDAGHAIVRKYLQ